MKFATLIRSAVLLLTVMLTACGSSSSDHESGVQALYQNESVTRIGRFGDTPVAGLDYITSSGLMGKTNSNGEFEYIEGDEVTFSVGELALGTIIAAYRVTVFDLAGFVITNADANFVDLFEDILGLEDDDVTAFGVGVNMLIFLQSLDSNNNPTDGIAIAAMVGEYILDNSVALPFDQSTNGFVLQFLEIFTKMATIRVIDRDTFAEPVDRDDAILHFLFND